MPGDGGIGSDHRRPKIRCTRKNNISAFTRALLAVLYSSFSMVVSCRLRHNECALHFKVELQNSFIIQQVRPCTF